MHRSNSGKFNKAHTVTCSSCHQKGHNARTCHKTQPLPSPKTPLKKVPLPVPNPKDLHEKVRWKKNLTATTMLHMFQQNNIPHSEGSPSAADLAVWWELTKKQSDHVKVHTWEGHGNLSEQLTAFIRHVVPTSVNSDISDSTWAEFFEELTPEENLAAASSQGMPQSVLLKLAHSPFVAVRQEVARNRSSPPEAFQLLRNDVASVRHHVAANPEAGNENFTYLSKDSEPNVRKALAFNRNCSEETLQNMYEKENDVEVKKMIKAGLEHRKYLRE